MQITFLLDTSVVGYFGLMDANHLAFLNWIIHMKYSHFSYTQNRWEVAC